MSYTSSVIGKLANELIAAIFLLCLPTSHSHSKHFYPAKFIVPSPNEAPLLVCSVCSHWRVTAIHLALLWQSLDTENVRPELVELWLHRAQQLTLSLQISPPIVPTARRFFLFAPVVPDDSDFLCLAPPQSHLLLPQIPRCRHLELVDWATPDSFPIVSSPIPLESLAIRTRPDAFHATAWVSQLLLHAPLLTALDWQGPDVAAPWGRLIHLSWDLALTNMMQFGQTLESLTCVTNLHMSLMDDHDDRFTSFTTFHVIPNVTTFSLWGAPELVLPLILPNLQHLILEYIWIRGTPKSVDALVALLSRSKCCLVSLELWGHHFPVLSPNLLVNLSVVRTSPTRVAATHSLTCLLISSHDLNEFFCYLEADHPGMLSSRIQLLRGTDCPFRIEPLPGINDDGTSGELATLIKTKIPRLERLQLEDRDPQDFSIGEQVESRCVTLNGEFKFVVSCSVHLRCKYKSWWNSGDGLEFRAALDAENTEILKMFEIPPNFLLQQRDPPHDTQNIYANSERSGYKFV
ncbi:hypothetical protein MVEN_00500800 [Mycena venus]|uniref:F-box domain-containing protein n=1 Tax=Mycena venus TaxID=2733690 RepID=A0A8H7D9G2_9AGAR|nr:hypothetical protein MVEN_00500800 [Mycena venus]